MAMLCVSTGLNISRPARYDVQRRRLAWPHERPGVQTIPLPGPRREARCPWSWAAAVPAGSPHGCVGSARIR